MKKYCMMLMFIILLTITSCSRNEQKIEADTILSENKVIEETFKEQTEGRKISIENGSETPDKEDSTIEWNKLLLESITTQRLEELYDYSYPQIVLNDYIDEGLITMESFYTNDYGAYLIDINNDQIDELLVHRKEGSGGKRSTEVFKMQNGVYKSIDNIPETIRVIKYKGKYRFISQRHDFQTKFLNSIIEFEVDGDTLIPINNYEVSYSYDIDESLRNIVDLKYLNNLNEYDTSSIDRLAVRSDGNTDNVIEIIDELNSNKFVFSMRLVYTSVHHFPNYWVIESDDDFTKKFDGVDNIINDIDVRDEGHIICGVDIVEVSDTINLIIISYPYFTMSARKSGELTLKVYRFKKTVIEQIYNDVLYPNVKVEVSDNFY